MKKAPLRTPFGPIVGSRKQTVFVNRYPNMSYTEETKAIDRNFSIWSTARALAISGHWDQNTDFIIWGSHYDRNLDDRWHYDSFETVVTFLNLHSQLTVK